MDPHTRRVWEIMQTEVTVLAPNECLDLADDVMRLGLIRHLPVVDHTRLVGLVSSRDLLAASLTKSLDFDPMSRRAFMRVIEVSEVMSRNLVTVGPDATLSDAAALLLKHKIGCLPVVDDDQALVGLITETDFLTAAFLTPDDRSWSEGADLGEGLDAELEALQRVREELGLQHELEKMELREISEEMENKLDAIEAKVKRTSKLAEAPLHDVLGTVRALLAELREGYRRIREVIS